MRRKVFANDGRRDHRVEAMLVRHVRETHGSAPIRTKTDATLRKRLAVGR